MRPERLYLTSSTDYKQYISHSYNCAPTISVYYKDVNSVLRQLGEECSDCAFVPAIGLPSNPDNLHFSAAALKEFGVRYYTAYQTLEKQDEADTNSGISTERTALEQL